MYWRREDSETSPWSFSDVSSTNVTLPDLVGNVTYLIKVHTRVTSSDTPIASYIFKFTTKASAFL